MVVIWSTFDFYFCVQHVIFQQLKPEIHLSLYHVRMKRTSQFIRSILVCVYQGHAGFVHVNGVSVMNIHEQPTSATKKAGITIPDMHCWFSKMHHIEHNGSWTACKLRSHLQFRCKTKSSTSWQIGCHCVMSCKEMSFEFGHWLNEWMVDILVT